MTKLEEAIEAALFQNLDVYWRDFARKVFDVSDIEIVQLSLGNDSTERHKIIQRLAKLAQLDPIRYALPCAERLEEWQQSLARVFAFEQPNRNGRICTNLFANHIAELRSLIQE